MIKKIDHIAIAVRDLEASSRFYVHQLGLSVAHEEDVPSQKVRVAFIPIGDTRIELVQPTTDDSPIGNFLQKRGEGLHHICLETTDLNTDLQRLKDQQTQMIDQEPREGAHHTRIVFVHPKANSGVLTELAEHPPQENLSSGSYTASTTSISSKTGLGSFVAPPAMPDDETPLGPDDMAILRTFFESAYKPVERWKIGLEYEVSGLHQEDMSPIEFYGERNIEGILAAFCAKHPHAETSWEDGFCFGLKPSYGNITLEPGAQIELSTKPSADLDELRHMMGQFLQELSEIGRVLQLDFYIAGVDPFHPQQARPWSHKPRYKLMRTYLIQRGKYAHHMMQQTMSAQFNIDYSNEADALLKYEASRRLQPVFLFLASNSKIYEGKESAQPMRGLIWQHTDPDRCGLPPAISSFDDYVNYALDIPVFFFVRDGMVPVANGLTFREFLRDGFQGHRARFADWALHLTTLFPEVRFKKNALELRMFDGNSPALTMAFCAVVKGIFFHPDLLEQVNQRPWSATWEDAEVMLNLARQGLSMSEQFYLEPLVLHIRQRKQPGAFSLQVLAEHAGDWRALLDHLRVA